MKISVIIPVYNCEDKIKRCVDSILAQGIKELEIILNSIVMNKNRITDSRIKFIKDTNNI